MTHKRSRSTLILTRGGGSGKEYDLITVNMLQRTETAIPAPTSTNEDETPANPNPVTFTKTNLVFPVHIAVQKGNIGELIIFLNSPQGNPFKQDFKGRTPLHYSANYGNQQTALAMTIELLNCQAILNSELINTARAQLINVQDENGETALHLAAKNGHRKLVQLFLFTSADVNKKSKEGVEPIELIYAKVPQAMCAVFDTCISYRSGEICDDSFEVFLDFGAIVGYPDEEEMNDPFQIESDLLAYALKNSESKCKEILVHPLVQLFLHFKWKKIRPLFWTSILTHIAWLLVYSTFLVDLYLHRCPYVIPSINGTDLNPLTNEELFTSSSEIGAEESHLNYSGQSVTIHCPQEKINIPLACAAASISFIMCLKELYELCSVPTFGYYFKKLENIGQLLLIVLVVLTTLPVWYYLTGQEDFAPIDPWQYQAAAFGVFLAWTLILGQIGKTPRLGIYVEILLKVLKSFGWFVLTFTSLLTAFALSFSIIMPKNEAFKTWPLALSKVLVMMTGELNYDEVFYSEEGEPLPFLVTGHIFFATFTVTVTIILFNLLIGLTVSDIQGLQDKAKVSGLSSQLEQIYLMESFLFSRHMKRITKCLRINTNFLRNFQIAALDDDEEFGVVIPTRLIPKHLQSDVKDLATQNLGDVSSKRKESCSQSTDGGVKGVTEVTPEEKEDLKVLIRAIVHEVLKQQDRKVQDQTLL